VLPDPPLELHFYGSINDCSDYFTFCPDAIKPMVFVHGLCTRERVAQAMVDADILVNIGNNSEEQLASKVVEYMSVGKPVLNIISIKGDVSIAELEGYPAKLTIMRSHEAPSEDVIEAIRSFVLKPPPVDRSCVNKIRSRYSTKRIAGLYESILLGSLPRLPKF
jgi:glycosyltransferase involved in cell wall biosynthesis